MLPFIIGDRIPPGNVHYDLLLLLRCMDIIYAPLVSSSQTVYLKHLISEPHTFSKRVASVNCNFKNICKSLACKHQVLQCTAWCGEEMRVEIECLGGCMTAVESLEGSEIIKEQLHLAEGSEVFVATQVSVFGTHYKQNLFVATGSN